MNIQYLDNEHHQGITIMIFVEGTILKPKSWLTLYKHNSYIPIGNAVKIIDTWKKQGATIVYCTSRRNKQVNTIVKLLKEYGFVGNCLLSREPKESYKEIVEVLQPDILIEDDCRSIGGSMHWCITKVNSTLKEKIKSIVVKEFKGIDHLSKDLKELIK